jgi:Amt family ammonium transporter
VTEIQTGLCILFLIVAPLAGAGVALINTGLGRSRNAAHAMMSALCVVAVAACAYFVLGRAWQGFSGLPFHSLSIGGKTWDWIGAQPLFFIGLPAAGSPALLTAWMGMIAAGTAGLIPLGSGSDRWRLSAICASTALLAGCTFPLFAHWTWGGGWLSQLGQNFGLGQGYLDPGGAGAIHVTGGLTALAIAWILGPRRGKYTPDGMPMAIPGHDAVMVLFGCFVAAAGWLGLNCAGAILFARAEAGQLPLIAIDTMLSAAGGALAAAAVTRFRYGKPDASLTANGWTGGLVASSAAASALVPATALLTGLLAGVLVALSVEFLDLRLEIDDPGGSIPVYAVAGIWGILAVGLFGQQTHAGQFLAQVVGVATLVGFVLPLTYGLNWLLNRILRQRVGMEGEHQGMDLHELGAGAYPEFMTHSDDSVLR